ncbi:protein-glutamate O-methyltransferase CheR [Sphingobacterium daejeonense]|uniref:CheR family methyltransferase n=1 Tax=Sphingobacterium daejeonense TaxID=371142 RepID=UPI0021A682A8|nr:protein-glutamate O-methyltransferase CheR [Sphingobacterium daejeonense]MCT1532669.1 protein-glutamate O-methyltransferase CheR [Sphingobacterium daejeonense]
MEEGGQVEWFVHRFFERFGFDFRDYSRGSLERRLLRILSIWKSPDLRDLYHRLQSDPSLISVFVQQITVPFTTMFRDPGFFFELRRAVLPYLSTFPTIRVWIAGCATGEEAYALAILLKECGLLERSLVYATDLNPHVVERASKGIFPVENVRDFVENYVQSGGTEGLSAHYMANHGFVQFDSVLRSRMVFSTHNLVSDSSFNSFQLILCRNVLIYFNRSLQNRVLDLFYESLENAGYLGLGPRETIVFSTVSDRFQRVGPEKLWQKCK